MEVLVPYRVLGKSSSSTSSPLRSESSNPVDAVIFTGICLVLGIACRHVLRGTRVPYTVALLVIGIGLGSLEYGTSHKLGKIGDGIRLWADIDPDLLLAVFLPALLFESSFSMEVHQIKRCLAQMLLLAGPGVLISTLCLGSALKLTFPYKWDWKTSLLLGGLLSATDPVAVVALLKELGASKKLSTIIEGESLMNDGTAIVVYQLFFKMVMGQSFNWGAIVKFLSQVALGAVGIGLAFGFASVLWLGFIFNDTVIEITLTLAVSYIAYFTAQEGAEVSGVLTVMTLGMFYAAVAKTAFKGNGQQSLHHFWEMVAYIANTLIFILSGVVIAEGILGSDSVFKNHGNSWGFLFLLYIYVQLSRGVVIGVLYPFLRYFGYGLDWKEATILTWSGLRGAVALSLSLSVKRSSDNSIHISSEAGKLFVFFTGGIVFLTLIVNGSTTQFILHFLRMDKLSATKRRILEFTKYEMLNKALEAFGDLGDDEELGPADWPTVKRYIASLNDLEEERVHPHGTSESETLDPTSLKDIRVRLLNGVQAAYWGMLDEGRVTQTTAILLMQSVDEGIDSASHEALCDWNGLKSNVHFPSYYKFLQSSICPRKLVTYFTVERLESACYICAAFLRAHRIARQQLHDFLGDSNVASIVINESKAEGEEARKFLEDVRLTFPQVLRVVKTRQVTYSVLNHLIDYVQNLERVGLLEEKEMLHLQDAVQTDLKGSHMMRQLHDVYDPGKIKIRIKIVPASRCGIVAAEAMKTQSNWVILDKQLKHEMRCCMEELHCNVVAMKRSRPKVLRLNLIGSPKMEPQKASSSSFQLQPLLRNLKSESNKLDMIRGPSVTPASSPEQESSLTATDVGTSSISSSDPGTSPFLLSGIFASQKKAASFINEEKQSLFESDSDTDNENEGPPSRGSCSRQWMTNLLSSSGEFSELFTQGSTKHIDSALTSTYEVLLEKLSTLGREPDVGACNYKLDLKLSKSVREVISLSRNAPPRPPPLCSICQHKAPIFGNPPKWFSYAELELATDGFSQKNFLAEGGFGSVHRGLLPGGQVVAVKQYKIASSQGDREFCSEVEVLSCAQHRNVVLLIGFCVEGGRRLLVYEYICNGSLDCHLYGRARDPLTWSARQKVAVGAARGLRYLHEECRVGCIVHRDMRPNNILLTHDFEPLVGDFGLARWQPDGDKGVETRVIGTFGYLAPEYAQSGQITEKADVYSFGVVLVELITGRKAMDIKRPKGQQCLTEWARPLLQRHAIHELLDPCLRNCYAENEVYGMMQCAMMCIRRDPNSRPRMSQVLRMLEVDSIMDSASGM